MIKSRKRKYGFQTGMFLLLFFICFSFLESDCYAGVSKSWTADADQGIYNGRGEDAKDKSDTEDEEKPSKIEKWVAGMISGLATGINGEFEKLGMSLDQVICGRVGTGEDVAMFSFELVKGNPYGTIAAAIYDIIRSIIYIVMAIILTAISAKAMYQGGTGQSREKFKASLSAFLWYYALLYLMPYLLDLFLYIRDQILYAVMNRLTVLVSSDSGMSADSLNLISHYKEFAASSPSITNALMYLGAVFITFFFVFEYAGMAMAMVIMVILFPFMCVKANIQRQAMEGWACDVFSIAVTPVLDMVLMTVPILTGIWFPEMWLLKMAMCGLVIPSRNAAKRALGLSSAGAGLLNGVMAAMALRSAGGLAKKGFHRVSSIGEAVRNGKEDRKKQHYHEDMAKMEAEENRGKMEQAGYAAVSSPLAEKGMGKKKKENAGGANSEGNFGMDEIYDGAAGQSAEEIAGDLGQRKDMLQDSVHAGKKKVAALNKDKSGLELENARLREREAKSGGRENFSEKIAENNQKIAGINDEIAGARQSVAENEAELAGVNRKLQNMQGAAFGFSGTGKGTASAMQQEIAGRHADIHNFERPEFSLLSHADKAALYQKRAKKNFMSAMAQSVPIASGAVLGASLGAGAGIGGTLLASAAGAGIGTSGSAGGALAGAGAGLFYGPALAAQTAGIGSGIAGAGSAAVTLAAENIAPHMPNRRQLKPSSGGQAYVPAGQGALGGNKPSSDHGGAGIVVPAGPLPPGPPAAGYETRQSPVFGNITAGSADIYDVNAKASRFVSRNFGNISSHLSEKMAEPGFCDEVKYGMQGAVSRVGYGKLSFIEKQRALSRGGAEVFAKSAMKMLEQEGLAYGSAEYAGVYNRLLEEFSSEKTIQKMAGAMLEQEKKILDFVDQDGIE